MAKGRSTTPWILLDSQSALILSNNADLLSGIKMVVNQVNGHNYAGMRLTKQTGHHPLFNLETWFNLHSIANIFLLSIVTKHYPIVFNTVENFFTFHLQDREIVFRQSEGGLYSLDTM